MILSSLFANPTSVLVLFAIIGMIFVSAQWFRIGQRSVDQLTGGLHALRRFSADLSPNHPVRKRIESAPVVEISLEEVAKLMSTHSSGAAVEGLLALQQRSAWIERFSQICVHLGILGTVLSLVASDPSKMESFRQQLPMALGTTFWGLIGTLVLSTISGAVNGSLERTAQLIRRALIDSFDQRAPIDDDEDDDQADSVPTAPAIAQTPANEAEDEDEDEVADEADDEEDEDEESSDDEDADAEAPPAKAAAPAKAAKAAPADDDIGLMLPPAPEKPAAKPASKPKSPRAEG